MTKQTKTDKVLEKIAQGIIITQTTAAISAFGVAALTPIVLGAYQGYTGQQMTYNGESIYGEQVSPIASYIGTFGAVMLDSIGKGNKNDSALLGALICPIPLLYGLGAFYASQFIGGLMR